MTERMTISMDDDLAERINDQLEWGDNRSELVRELLREALDSRELTEEYREEQQEKPEPVVTSDLPENKDSIQDALSGWRHGRDDQEQAASQEVAEQATEWLQETQLEKVSKSDVPLDELADDDPLGRDPETLWTEIVRSAWKHAVERGSIEQPNSRSYRWVGYSGDSGNEK